MVPAIHCAHREMVPLDALKEHPRNPNRHPEAQVALLAEIIKTQGWRAPITVSKRSGFITRGHARLAAAKRLNLTEAPVDFQDYPDDASELADMVADNRISELADLSQAAVKEILMELDGLDFNVALAGYDGPAWDALKNAFMPDAEMAPTDLPDPGIAGLDPSAGRFILVYRDETEKQFWIARAGIKGDKVIVTPEDVPK